MKNKKLTYVLFPGAILIWVIVIYRIIAAVGPSDSGETARISPKKFNTEKYTRDTFELISNYRDPFLGSIAKKPVAQKKTKTKPKKQKKKPEKVEWPHISYEGIIRNEKSGEEVAVLRIDGMEYLMRKGDVVQNVKVKSFEDGNIDLVFGEEGNRFLKSR